MISQVDGDNDKIQVIFWGTEYFKNEEGVEVPFGAQVEWEVSRQMSSSQKDSVETTLFVSRTLLILIGIFTLLLVLSCGPLLPVWMFLNTLHLISMVPLLRTNLPGNFNFFLLEYLNVLRLHTFALNVWLQEQVGNSKAEDSALVLADEPRYYTSLVHQAGYSFSFLPNLILIFCLFGLVFLIWMVATCRDHMMNGFAGKKRAWEPYLTNFLVRFFYEIFFEVILCLIINVSSTDFDASGSSSFTKWVICLVLIIAAIAALVAITTLLWRGGPVVE